MEVMDVVAWIIIMACVIMLCVVCYQTGCRNTARRVREYMDRPCPSHEEVQMGLIRELTDREVSWVTIHHPNPDFDGPSFRIEAGGDWQNPDEPYAGASFYGDTLTLALVSASAKRRRALATRASKASGHAPHGRPWVDPRKPH